MSHDDNLADAVKVDYREAGLDAKTRALMDYAVVVTGNAHDVSSGTIDGLRDHGWTDEDILMATQIVGFFNYYTRMVDALGVEPEGSMVAG